MRCEIYNIAIIDIVINITHQPSVVTFENKGAACGEIEDVSAEQLAVAGVSPRKWQGTDEGTDMWRGSGP
jgi:hypothetical protein